MSVAKQARELYDEHRVGNYSYGEKRHKYDGVLMSWIKSLGKDKTVYDVGCGAGNYLEAFAKWGVPKENLVGVDFAPTNVAELKQRGYNAICDDVLKLQIPDAVADFTFSQGVIHHTDDPWRAFQELVRITKPGGHLYVNLYNQWTPYFWIVHRATFPIRFIYWNISKRIVDILYPFAAALFQPLAYLVMGEFLNKETAKTFFMDQVITPRAYLFSRAKLEAWAKACGCTVIESAYNRKFLMVYVLMQKPAK